MKLKLSRVKVDDMSDECGIKESHIEAAFDEDFEPVDPTKVNPVRRVQESKAPVEEELEEENPQNEEEEFNERLSETETAQEVHSMIEDEDYSTNKQYIAVVEKLSQFLLKELKEVDDFDDVHNLLECSLDGSPEQALILTRYVEFVKDEATGMDDFEDLKELYDEVSDICIDGKQFLLERIITCTDNENLEDVRDFIPEGSSAWQLFIKKESELLEKNIADTSDDFGKLHDLYDEVETNSLEEKHIAERIIKACGDDTENLLEEALGFFANQTYGYNLALARLIELYDTSSELNDLKSKCSSHTAEIYSLNEKFDKVVASEIEKADLDELDAIDEYLESDTYEYQLLLQRKVGLIDDVEDFYRLINDKLEEGTKAYDMAIAKIHESVATDIENCSTDMDALYELKETYANNFNEFKPVYEKIFTLCKTQDDFEKLDNEINDNTCYLSYQISKKLESFYSDAPVVVEKKVVPVMEAKDPIEEEGQREETEFSRRCEEAEMEYISARSHEAARKAYNLSPAGSDVQKKAFAKLEKYIKESLAKSSLTQKQVLSIYKSAIPMTESWRLAIQKLAEFYKKPWWYI